ncbi:hypothetical protein V5799_026324 [Amblyomma americanum]|uniref:Serpin domain-containing protein n=1 Tax=Amblyomma americanum TaxID=6943 RepID=A0AAQ4DIX4_AMBAM
MASKPLGNPLLDFSVDLYKQLILQGSRRGNIVYSPLSICAALLTAVAGARGNTAKEISAVLRVQDSDNFHRRYSDVLSKRASAGSGVKVHSVNRIYCEQAFPVLDTYRSLLRDRHEAAIESVDFRGDYKNVRQRVNSWIEEATESKVRGFLAPGSLDALTNIIFVNAVHIKGFWESQFSPTKTIRYDFFGFMSVKQVATMTRMGEFKTASCDDLNVRAVEIPYRGGKSSMVVIKPQDNLFALEKRLTAPKLARLLKNLQRRGAVWLYLPKFKLEQAVDLKVTLQGIGIKDLFTPDADLSGISEAANLFYKNVFHKTVMEVSEEGDDVLFATSVPSFNKSPHMLDKSCRLVVDKPFMFLVRSRDPDLVLCMGSVLDV